MSTKVVVVGCGYWGKNLVRNFRELDALAGVCDATEKGRELAASIAPACNVYSDLDQALTSDDARGVVIATPAETHYEVAKQALAAGKDVFVEKPLAINYQDGAKLVKRAGAAGRILMVGHVLEYHPALTKLVQMVKDGVIGKVQYIYSNRLSLGKIRREENILWSFAPHDIALILRIMGKMPFQVVACGGSFVQANIADVTVTNLLFDNGVRAHIFVSWLHPFKEQRLVVIGSEKMISYDDVSKQLLLYDQRVEVKQGEPVPIKGDGEPVVYAADEPLKMECQAFLNAIADRQAPLTDGQSGLDVLRVLQTAQRSLIMNGEQVAIPENGHLSAEELGKEETPTINIVENVDATPSNGKGKVIHVRTE